jgi:signal transduction histidine kinase/ActR/RegA family two-component response regulator
LAPLSDPPGDQAPIDSRSRLQALLELTNRLSEQLETEEVARVVVDQARVAVGAVTTILWALDEPPTHATLVRAAGHSPGALPQYQRIPLEPWLPMGDAMLRREALFFESRADFRERYPIAERLVTGQEPFSELSYACLPLVAHGRAIAGLSLVFPGERVFDEDERRFLFVLAHHAGQALERARLFQREKQSRRRLESLQQLTSSLSSAATVGEVAALATRAAVGTLGFAGAVIWATNERADLCLLSETGMTEEHRERFRCIPHDSVLPAARVARDRRPVWCETERDVESEDPSLVAVVRRDDTLRSYGAVPLVREDRVLGVLAFSAGRPWRFLPEERAFMTTIAEQCADALARARLHDDARDSKHLLQSVLERLPVGVIVSRPPDSTLVLSNEALATIWRTDALPTRGEDRCKLLKASYPDGRPIPMAESPVVRALRGESVDGLEARIERRDGSIGWIQASAAPVLRDDGTVKVAVATFVDVSAVKEARAAAEEAGRAKDEFLAMLGHELRNPLTPIVTALDLMDLRGGDAFRSERTIISRQVRHMVRMVDDLLDISRITRGKILLHKEYVEAGQLVAGAIETTRSLFEQRSQTLTVSVAATGLPLLVDPGRLSQAVANLLTNAAKYTEPGGRIAVIALREERQVFIRVRDSGIGIEPEVLPRVFDLFVQAEGSIDRSQGGLGIGLAIARNLVELHGGSIVAHSDGAGRGSEFIIRLPLAPGAEVPPPGREPPMVQSSAHPFRVLIVDDNEDIADGLSAMLRLLGCVTRIAHDGPSAIAAVASFDADLVLLDIGLPVMNGYEVARQFRRLQSTSKIRLVALTGYGQAADERRSLDAGFDEHLVKPLGLDSIREVLARFARAVRDT